MKGRKMNRINNERRAKLAERSRQREQWIKMMPHLKKKKSS